MLTQNHIILQRLIIFAFILRGGLALAQSGIDNPENQRFFYPTPITTSDGLSQGSVYTLYQDSKGFTWLGTYEGLNRYDGQSILCYYANKKNPRAIYGMTVWGIAEDKNGDMWIGTEKGLNRYNRRTNDFTPFFNPDTSTVQNQTRPFFADSSEVWYLNQNEGMVRLNFKTHEKTIIESSFRFKSYTFIDISITKGPNGDIWMLTEKGIARKNYLTNTLETFFSDLPNNKVGQPMEISTYVVENDTSIYLATDKGMVWLNPLTLKWTLLPLPFDPSKIFIYNMVRDWANCLWFSTGSEGVFILDMKTKKISRLGNYTSTPNRFNNIQARVLLPDNKNRVMWLCIENNGVEKIVESPEMLTNYRYDPINKKDLNVPTVRCFAEDPTGKIWIGTWYGGINIFDPTTKTFSYITHNSNEPNSLHNNVLYSLIIDSRNRVWAGTEKGIAYLPNTKSNQWKHISATPTKANDANVIKELCEMPDGNILVGTDKGIYIYDPIKNKFNTTTCLESINEIYFHKPTQTVFVAQFAKGLSCYKYEKGNLSYLFSDFIDADIFSIAFDEKTNAFWVGTIQGLAKYDFKTRTHRLFQTTEGLPSNCIYGVEIDNEHFIWCSTNRGIARFNPQIEKFTVFDKTKGTQGYEYNIKAHYKARNGALYFGGVEGFDRILTHFFNIDKTPPIARILSASVNNIPIVFSDTIITYRQNWHLQHFENSFSLAFQAFHRHFSKQDIKYRYQLEGYDKTWQEVNTNAVAYFTKVPPGNYRFKLQAAQNEGDWGDVHILNIIIQPAFWQTTWFRSLITLLFLGLIWYWQQRNKLKALEIQRKEESFKRRLAETEMAALRSQMNPHFIFNVLNSINDYMLNHDSKAASQYLTDFSKLIRLVLENSRSEKVSIGNELAALELYLKFEQLRFEHKLHFTIELDKEIDTQFVKIPPMLIQPYIENAIWHGLMHRPTGGTVALRIKQLRENLLHIEVEDDGIGREAATELKSKSAMRKKSYGMTITSERIQLVNEIFNTTTQVSIQDLVDTEGGACGTKVIIEIPC